jgi:predicted transglutaminase-like cysteine proteinase
LPSLFSAFGRSLALLGACAALAACADLPSSRSAPLETSAHPVAMAVRGPAIPPAGLIGFCVKYLSECKTVADSGSVVVALDGRRRQELEMVQAKVNAAIEPRDIPGNVWSYPVDGTGECNQYALEKRRELIALGWPREALLLTAALTEGGEGHLVLVARTSAGDLVLDNRLAPVVDWRYLPYHWLTQQTPQSLAEWVSIDAAPARLASADQRHLL